MGDSKIEFINLWNTLLKIESFAESLRQWLSNRPGFSIYEAFLTVDVNDNKLISRDELKDLLSINGFYISEKDVTALVYKLCTYKNDRISYSEVSISI